MELYGYHLMLVEVRCTSYFDCAYSVKRKVFKSNV